MDLSKIMYISFKYEKYYENMVYLFGLEKLLSADPPITELQHYVDEYLNKLFYSQDFLMEHRQRIKEACATTAAEQAVGNWFTRASIPLD